MNAKFKNTVTTIMGILLWIVDGYFTFFETGERRIGTVPSIAFLAIGLLLVWAWNDLMQKFVKKTLKIQ